MNLKELLEWSELIPKDSTQAGAEKVAQELVRAAQQKAYESGKPNATYKMAHILADRFHSNVLAAIDREIEFLRMKSVDVD